MAGDKNESREIKKYKKLLLLAQNSKDFKQEAACCNVLGNAYVQNAEFDKALEMHVEEKRLCNLIKDKIGYAVAHRMMGDVYLAKEDFESGMEELQKYLQLSSNFPVELQRANTQLGKSLYEYARSCDNHPQKSLLLVKNGIKHLVMSVTIAKDLQLKRKVVEKEGSEMMVRSYINLAISYHHLSMVDSTTRYQPQIQQYFLKATTIAKKRYMFDELYLIYHLMASQSCDFNKCKVAVENCKVAIEYGKKCSDEDNVIDGFVFCGQMLLCTEDVENVKKYWKAAYNMMKPNQRCDFIHKLKTVFKISQLYERISSEKEGDLVNIYEKLGDLYCKLEAYRPAVSYYERLQALFGGKKGEGKMEANNLYSLAQTYSDLRRYDEAIRYYLEEIKLRDDRKEKSTSLLQVALCLEKQNCGDLSKITPHLQQALQYANEENCDVTKVKVLQVKEEILRRFNRCNEANKIRVEINQVEENLPQQQEDSEETVVDDSEGDDFDERLFNIQLSSIDTSIVTGAPVDGMKRSARRRGGSSLVVEKKNAKGETPLHQACLTGQYNKAQQLVQMGHSVNTRDHFGWTPLHEVCNHGYADLVKLLLQHGAKVNVTAGDDIVTPMSDAAQNGHFEIVTMLYDAGADPTINNSKGRSTVAVLDGYHLREQLLGDEKKAYQETRRKLTGRGEVPQSQLLKSVPVDDDDDLLDSYRRPDDNDDDVIIDDMKKRRSATGGGGSSSSVTKRSVPTSNMRVTSSSTSFTHDVGDYDVTDDFLVDDSTPPRRKKARPSDDSEPKQRKISCPLFKPQATPVPATYPRRNSGGRKSLTKQPGAITQPAGVTSSRVSTTSPKWNDVVLIDDDVIGDVGEEISWDRPTVVKSSSSTYTPPTATQSPPPAPVSNKMKIKLKIDDMLFMVGVPCKTETIQWLNKCAVQRYEEATSIRVTITLTTEDHCLLSNHDVIGDVLSSGDVIIGQVKSRVVKALAESYREQCDDLQIGKIEVIENSCKECDDNKSMNLANYSFHYQQHLKPLLRVIGLQSSVTEINFSGNRIGPEGIACLCESIMTSSSQRQKSSLVTLNLKCCQLNGDSLLKLANCPYFHQVEKLDISHNPVNSDDGRELFQLLNNCDKIRILNISDCDVNMREFLQLPNIQSVFINLPDLERFDVSDNNLDVDDVRRLLSLLRHNRKLKWINLNSTITSQFNQFIDILLEFLEERKEHNLKYLNLKYNGLEACHLDKIRSNEKFMEISQLVL